MSNNKDDFEAEETPEHHDLIRSNTKDDFEAEKTPEHQQLTVLKKHQQLTWFDKK